MTTHTHQCPASHLADVEASDCSGNTPDLGTTVTLTDWQQARKVGVDDTLTLEKGETLKVLDWVPPFHQLLVESSTYPGEAVWVDPDDITWEA